MCPSIELTFIIHMSLASQSVTIHNVKVCALQGQRDGDQMEDRKHQKTKVEKRDW